MSNYHIKVCDIASDPPYVLTYRVDKFTSTGTRDASGPYYVKIIHGRWMCNCPDFYHRAQVWGDTCKHIDMVQEIVKWACWALIRYESYRLRTAS